MPNGWSALTGHDPFDLPEKQTYSPVPHITRLIRRKGSVPFPGRDTVFTVHYKQGYSFQLHQSYLPGWEANQYQWRLKG